MKKFAYTLVTSPQRNRDGVTTSGNERTLTLRETLIIDDGPSYYREYTVATAGFGFMADAEALAPG